MYCPKCGETVSRVFIFIESQNLIQMLTRKEKQYDIGCSSCVVQRLESLSSKMILRVKLLK